MTVTVTKEELRAAARAKKQEIYRSYPSLGFVPNIGQERFIKKYDREVIPYIGVFGGGNGTGKTTLMVNMLIAICYPERIVSEWLCDIQLCRRMHERVKLRGSKLVVRIVCHADSMKEGGALLQAIRTHFPTGMYSLEKGGKSFYSQITIKGSEFCDVIDVKTFDQDKVASSGTTIDVQFSDEPPPEETYSEMIGRTRSTDGFGGIMAFFLTPLELAGWMYDQIVDVKDDIDIVVVNAGLWENCKDIAGTRGVLSRESIQRQIEAWERLHPHEVEARVNGTFSHLSGSIYKLYTDEVHVVSDLRIPTYWPIYCIIDPHDTRYPAVAWFAVGENEAVCIHEWPDQDYTKLGPSDMTIGMICNHIRDIEMGFEGRVLYRFMDPNKGKTANSVNNLTMQQCYSASGLDFELASEDDLQIGHSKVNEILWFDRKREVGLGNKPYLRVLSHCHNMQKALGRYGIKRKVVVSASLSARIDPKYKDFADLARYFAVSRQPFQRADDLSTFTDRLLAGRNNR